MFWLSQCPGNFSAHFNKHRPYDAQLRVQNCTSFRRFLDNRGQFFSVSDGPVNYDGTPYSTWVCCEVEKILGPATRISVFGSKIDSVLGRIELSPDKLSKSSNHLKNMSHTTKVTNSIQLTLFYLPQKHSAKQETSLEFS